MKILYLTFDNGDNINKRQLDLSFYVNYISNDVFLHFTHLTYWSVQPRSLLIGCVIGKTKGPADPGITRVIMLKQLKEFGIFE